MQILIRSSWDHIDPEFNSLAPGNCGNKFQGVISEPMLQNKVLNISFQFDDKSK